MNPLVDKALQAHQNAENLTREAIQSLLTEQKTIADQLKALGHIAGQKAPVKSAPAKPKSPCKVCKSPDHDARFHRGDAQKATPPKPPAPATAAK